jgi:hypothetical protein
MLQLNLKPETQQIAADYLESLGYETFWRARMVRPGENIVVVTMVCYEDLVRYINHHWHEDSGNWRPAVDPVSRLHHPIGFGQKYYTLKITKVMEVEAAVPDRISSIPSDPPGENEPL